jgi:hypothetical protein
VNDVQHIAYKHFSSSVGCLDICGWDSFIRLSYMGTSGILQEISVNPYPSDIINTISLIISAGFRLTNIHIWIHIRWTGKSAYHILKNGDGCGFRAEIHTIYIRSEN